MFNKSCPNALSQDLLVRVNRLASQAKALDIFRSAIQPSALSGDDDDANSFDSELMLQHLLSKLRAFEVDH